MTRPVCRSLHPTSCRVGWRNTRMSAVRCLFAATFLMSLPSGAPAQEDVISGTGFVIGINGEVLTNAHLVNTCSDITVRMNTNAVRHAKVAAISVADDLAVLETNAKSSAVASFRPGNAIRPGDTVVALGYPLTGFRSFQAVASDGIVNALTGSGDDPRYLQISAPVQPGSSGGPLLDLRSDVVGVVSAKLDAPKVFNVKGDIPQNVNFAIKSNAAIEFLNQHRIDYFLRHDERTKSPADVAQEGRRFTVYIECRQARQQQASVTRTNRPPPVLRSGQGNQASKPNASLPQSPGQTSVPTIPTFEKSSISIETATGNWSFDVELAVTPEQHAWGISFRTSLPGDRGMLYLDPAPTIYVHSMRNTLIPLDLLFIAADGRITQIVPGRTPGMTDIRSSQPVKAMLELAAGLVERTDIARGDVVHFASFNNSTVHRIPAPGQALEVGPFTWEDFVRSRRSRDSLLGAERYSFVFRNKTASSIKNIKYVIVFFDAANRPIDSNQGSYAGPILAGLAKTVEGPSVGPSVNPQMRSKAKSAQIRVLGYDTE